MERVYEVCDMCGNIRRVHADGFNISDGNVEFWQYSGEPERLLLLAFFCNPIFVRQVDAGLQGETGVPV